MANIEFSATANLWQGDNNAGRVSLRPTSTGAYYHLAATSGLLTGIAAGTATAGHIFCFRNGAATLAAVTRILWRWWTVAGFTPTAQEVQLAVYRLTGYTASHTGGTAISPTGSGGLKKKTSFGTSACLNAGNAQIATTGALTSVTNTLDAQPWMANGFSELVAGAAVPKGFFSDSWEMGNHDNMPLVLDLNEGLIVRNEVLMGAGGTGRLHVQMDWYETTAFPG